MTWTIALPIDLPSANKLIVAARGGMSARAAGAKVATLRRQYAAALLVKAREVGIPRNAQARRHVTIVRLMGERQREYDSDNMVAACKTLRDAMQVERSRRGRAMPGAGIVWDDSPTWSEWAYEQRRAEDGKAGVLVVVRDIEPRSDP